MNKTLFSTSFIFLSLLLCIRVGLAQEQSNLCLHKLKVAAAHLTSYENIELPLLNEITKSIQDCLDSEYPTTHYIKGLLILKQNPSEEDKVRAFQLIKSAASKNHKDASCLLGDLYKNGTGVSLDFDKALDSYKTAVLLGSQKASFKIGYLYLKGLGSLEQNYTKAVQWFEQSSYPMAKHWLGVCYYSGYGVVKDNNKALELLKNNDILNSKTLLGMYQEEDKNENSNAPNQDNRNSQNTQATDTLNVFKNEITEFSRFDIDQLSNSYTGKLIEYDWSGNRAVRIIPIEIALEYDYYDDEIKYNLTLDKHKKKGKADRFEDSAYFNNLSIPLDRLYTDNPNQTILDYEILSITFRQKEVANRTFLIGELATNITQWNEPGAPIRLILQTKSNTSELSNDILAVLAAQENSFIKLYPNPFETNLLVQYTLEESAKVQVEIYGISNKQSHKIIEPAAIQQSGKKLYRIDGADLVSGLYVVKVDVNGIQHTKLVLKK